MEDKNSRDQSGCTTAKKPSLHDQKCEPAEPASDFLAPAPKVERSGGSTIVRFYIGAREAGDMGGDIPEVGLFNELGLRVGEKTFADMQHGGGSVVPQGGFKDILIQHWPGHEATTPTYIKLNPTVQSVCISAIRLFYPDGSQQFINGDDFARCNRDKIITSASRAFVGSDFGQPKCFWLAGDNEQDGEMTRWMSLHLPDIVISPKRLEMYNQDPSRFCRQTPRFWTQKDQQSMHVAIPVWNPPFEYDPATQYDKDPNRQILWTPNWKYDLSDHPLLPWRPKNKWGYRARRRAINAPDSIAEFPRSSNNNTAPFDREAFPQTIRTTAPSLVVSTSKVSAQAQCLLGKFENTDYVSLSEQIYCDMLSRSMFHVCGGGVDMGCCDPERMALRNWDMQKLAMTGSVGSVSRIETAWAATGPLFGYMYQNVTMIA